MQLFTRMSLIIAFLRAEMTPAPLRRFVVDSSAQFYIAAELVTLSIDYYFAKSPVSSKFIFMVAA